MTTAIDHPATVASADGTIIAYHSLGSGEAVIVVGGALLSAQDYLPLARVLAPSLTVHVHRALGYAVRKKRLSANPLSKAAQPEGWTPPEAPDDALDYRTIGSPELVESMIETCRTLGTTQGARFRAFYGCMYFSMMRPSEVAALTLSACELPEDGWGWLTIADASTTAGRAYTDDGLTHEHRGLKGRTRGRPGTRARKPSRRIPAPPELVAMLREHIARFGAGPDGRVFRSERGNPIQASTWWQVWQKVRAASLTPGQLDGPLMIQPYCLRHAGVTRRLNEGVDEATVAAWAGHSVEVLRRIYHHSVGGQDEVLIARMDAHRRRSLWGRMGHTWGTEFGTGRHRLAHLLAGGSSVPVAKICAVAVARRPARDLRGGPEPDDVTLAVYGQAIPEA